MIKLLVLPEAVFSQYKTDGVQFTKLLLTNYIASVSSVNDLVEINEAIQNFPFTFGEDGLVEKADSPLVDIALKTTFDSDDQIKMQDLHNRLEERIATLALRKANEPSIVCVYSLYPVDENLWVVVQKSLHTEKGDPKRISIELNHNLFDNMINELTRTHSFEQVAKTNLFNYYLQSVTN